MLSSKEAIIMTYIYPAVFTPEADGGYLVDFPDIPNCFTDGDDLADAFENAEDALALKLWYMEEHGETIAPPFVPASLEVADGASVALVKADTIAVRRLNDTRAVRKNITLPGWLDAVAKEHHINFSQLLQNAIRRECGIEA